MFSIKENILVNYVRADKLFCRMCMRAVSDLHNFTANEVIVLMFLSNPDNAPMDTATEIAYYRNISKGLIARSVESLTQRGFLAQTRDQNDRRIVHLRLTAQSDEISRRLGECRRDFISRIQQGMSLEDRELFQRVSKTFARNLDSLWQCESKKKRKGKETHEQFEKT